MSSNELYDPPSAPADWDAPDALEQLKKRLETAVILELHTIPLYLFALYSVKEDNEVIRGFRRIVEEEMLHMVLAGNILRAIDGHPKVYGDPYVPKFPTDIFYEKIRLNLAAATEENIKSFKDLEHPAQGEVHGLLNRYHTIGEFYHDVRVGLDKLYEKHGNSLFIPKTFTQQFSPEDNVWFKEGLNVITDINSARAALELIVEQGEGGGAVGDKSHYKIFEKMLSKCPIECYPVVENPVTSSYKDQNIQKVMLASDAAYSYLLLSIETMWGYDGPNRGEISASIMALMTQFIAPLARFLVTQPLGGSNRNAAPPFNTFDFNPRVSAYAKFKDAIVAASAAYQNAGLPDEETLKSVFDIAGAQVAE